MDSAIGGDGVMPIRFYRKEGPPDAIRNEVRFLTALAGSGYVPKLLAYGETWVSMEQVDAEPVTDADAFLVECCRALTLLRNEGIVHGDLTDRNIIVRGNRPIMIDFSESRMAEEPGPDKRAEGDAYWLWQAYIGLTGDPRRHARRWLAIRERLKAAAAEKRSGRVSYQGSFTGLIDIGCARGDMVLMAHAEGITAMGVDLNGDFISPNCTQFDAFAVGWTAEYLLMLSVLPYLLQSRGWAPVEKRITDGYWRLLYVECQILGDGPGTFPTHDATASWLAQFGEVEEIVRIPLPDRGVDRVTFEVRR